MYESFFGLSEKPFSIQPDPSFLYWGRTHRLAYAMLEYGVLNHAGISVITGEVGCGKTTLIHRLLDQLSETHTIALLSNVQEGRGDLLSWVLMSFGEPFAGKSHVELFSQLQNFFISEYAKGRRVVLVIDEAQNLSTDMLEELRLLSNINAGKDQLLQLILVGQPQLKGLLNKPELLQLAQRVGADFHLTPLNREEVHAYLETRLSIAGCARRIFTDRAMDFISEQSKGVPRVINIIADTALVYAFSAEELVVGVDTVRNVVRDKTEFGVFGLASDEGAARPLPSANRPGLDAFADSGARDAAPQESGDKAETHRLEEEPQPEQPAEQAKSPREAPAESRVMPTLRDQSDAAPAANGRPDPIVEERPQQSVIAAHAEKEASAVTGVVIVATSDRDSPEAAIRSAGDGRAIVFVSRGEDDKARAIARDAGAVIAECPSNGVATVGKLRNAGYRQLKLIAPHIDFVQFIEADKAIAPDWISLAEKTMARRPEIAMVVGETAVGQPGRIQDGESKGASVDTDEAELDVVSAGDAFLRAQTFEEIGGFRGDIPAAAMADLSIRLRRRGGRIWRLDSIMAIGAKTKAKGFGAWWARHEHAGFENAIGARLHGAPPERLGVYESALAWFLGAMAPFTAIAAFGAAALLAPRVFPQLDWLTAVATVFVTLLLGFLGLSIIFGFQTKNGRRLGLIGGAASVLGRAPEFRGIMKSWSRKGDSQS